MLLVIALAGVLTSFSAHAHDEGFEITTRPRACNRAPAEEVKLVKEGLKKKSAFLKACTSKTGSPEWCNQVASSNPENASILKCTYGATQDPFLIHPDESTWDFAIDAVKLVRELENMGLAVCRIYNWWRPATYNANVGGAAARHPFGTSIDVRFCTRRDQIKAHTALCALRAEGRLRALGDYGGTGLHLGVGDTRPNTWGEPCPQD